MWLPDVKEGWKPAEIISVDNNPPSRSTEETLTLHIRDDSGGDTSTLTFPLSSIITAAQNQQLQTDRIPHSAETITGSSGKDAQMAGLPPLRNPPNMETEEDLSNLSNLNEPSGECLVLERVVGSGEG